ncbi:hypothetical protein C8J56DRAFT_943696 [Mycena floridula]|nr:hypothetical protein C8J56DRAFT_943696 [Mycena floridula]
MMSTKAHWSTIGLTLDNASHSTVDACSSDPPTIISVFSFSRMAITRTLLSGNCWSTRTGFRICTSSGSIPSIPIQPPEPPRSSTSFLSLDKGERGGISMGGFSELRALEVITNRSPLQVPQRFWNLLLVDNIVQYLTGPLNTMGPLNTGLLFNMRTPGSISCDPELSSGYPSILPRCWIDEKMMCGCMVRKLVPTIYYL